MVFYGQKKARVGDPGSTLFVLGGYLSLTGIATSIMFFQFAVIAKGSFSGFLDHVNYVLLRSMGVTIQASWYTPGYRNINSL